MVFARPTGFLLDMERELERGELVRLGIIEQRYSGVNRFKVKKIERIDQVIQMFLYAFIINDRFFCLEAYDHLFLFMGKVEIIRDIFDILDIHGLKPGDNILSARQFIY